MRLSLYCVCDNSITVDSSDPQALKDMRAVFLLFHTGPGHQVREGEGMGTAATGGTDSGNYRSDRDL